MGDTTNKNRPETININGLELIALGTIGHLCKSQLEQEVQEHKKYNKEVVVQNGKLYAGGKSIEVYNLDTNQYERLNCGPGVALPLVPYLSADIVSHEGIKCHNQLKFISDPAVVIPKKEGGFFVIAYIQEGSNCKIKGVYTTMKLDGKELIKQTTG